MSNLFICWLINKSDKRLYNGQCMQQSIKKQFVITEILWRNINKCAIEVQIIPTNAPFNGKKIINMKYT